MLVVTVNPEILFQGLVHSLGLPISFQVIPGGKMKSDVEGLSKGAEEMGDELQAVIRGYVTGDTVLGEYMQEE